MIGKTIFHYKILEKLGEGGMGVVYKAEDTKLKRHVALKFLPTNLTADEGARERFIQEAQTASALDHPNICTIYEINQTEDGQMFIAMAHYGGETLKQKIATGQLSIDTIVDFTSQIAKGLAKAHQHGIIHRDIKPANIIVTDDGLVKILDFGLAKLAGQARLTRTGTTLGTVAYMSPEQVHGEEVDLRTDIWSIGVVLYEMITRKLPFGGEYEQAIIYSIVHEEPAALSNLTIDFPSSFEKIVANCLAKSLENRYQTASDLLAALQSLSNAASPTFEKERKSSHRLWPGAIKTGKIKAPRSETTTLRIKRTWLYAGMALLLVLLVTVISLHPWRRTEPKARRASIAVLPFVNMSTDEENEYFSDGITEEIINALTKVKGLGVVARTSIFQFKGKAYDIRKIGEQLNVSTVLEGSVRKAGEKLRITAQLIDVADGYHLWSETFEERNMKDIFVIQDDIARAIVDKLKITLVSTSEDKLVNPHTENLEAYDLYLKGRFFWNKRTQDGLQKGLQYFEQAIEKDPAYALAYAGLADSYLMLGQFAYRSPHETFPKARAAAGKALEINDALAEAHNSLAYLKMLYERDWQAAEREFRRAIDLNPNYATAYQWYAEYLAAMARSNEALVAIERARELDPLSLIINSVKGYIFLLNSQYELSIEQFRKVIEMDPNFPTYAYLGRAYLQSKKYDEAIAEIQTEINLFGRKSVAMALLAYAYHVAGKTNEALKIRNELEKQSLQTYVEPYQMAVLYSGLRDNNQAFRWLWKAYEEYSGLLMFVKVDPFFNDLHSDSRFTELLKKMGFEK